MDRASCFSLFESQFVAFVQGIHQCEDRGHMWKRSVQQLQALAVEPVCMRVKPVIFPPGRERLIANPRSTGSIKTGETIGVWPLGSRA